MAATAAGNATLGAVLSIDPMRIPAKVGAAIANEVKTEISESLKKK